MSGLSVSVSLFVAVRSDCVCDHSLSLLAAVRNDHVYVLACSGQK